jgi:Sec-independent protein translocase protein TatA
MMGLGAGLPLLLALGFVVLGPKRMQAILGHIAKAKAELAKSSRDIKSRLAVELEGEADERK